jgi:hypothetical protein
MVVVLSQKNATCVKVSCELLPAIQLLDFCFTDYFFRFTENTLTGCQISRHFVSEIEKKQ